MSHVDSSWVGDSGFVADRGRLFDERASMGEICVDSRPRAELLLVKVRRWRILIAFSDSLRSISEIGTSFVYAPMVLGSYVSRRNRKMEKDQRDVPRKERRTKEGVDSSWSVFKEAPMHLQVNFLNYCEYQGRFKEALSAQLSGMRGKKNVENLIKDWAYGLIK